MSFAELNKIALFGTDDAQGESMKVYWFGLLGWLAILSLQLLFARIARAKRLASRAKHD